MYTELIQRCKQMYLTESDGEEDKVYQLPSFLDSIASVIIHLDKVTPEPSPNEPLPFRNLKNTYPREIVICPNNQWC